MIVRKLSNNPIIELLHMKHNYNMVPTLDDDNDDDVGGGHIFTS